MVSCKDLLGEWLWNWFPKRNYKLHQLSLRKCIASFQSRRWNFLLCQKMSVCFACWYSLNLNRLFNLTKRKLWLCWWQQLHIIMVLSRRLQRQLWCLMEVEILFSINSKNQVRKRLKNLPPPFKLKKNQIPLQRRKTRLKLVLSRCQFEVH